MAWTAESGSAVGSSDLVIIKVIRQQRFHFLQLESMRQNRSPSASLGVMIIAALNDASQAPDTNPHGLWPRIFKLQEHRDAQWGVRSVFPDDLRRLDDPQLKHEGNGSVGFTLS